MKEVFEKHVSLLIWIIACSIVAFFSFVCVYRGVISPVLGSRDLDVEDIVLLCFMVLSPVTVFYGISLVRYHLPDEGLVFYYEGEHYYKRLGASLLLLVLSVLISYAGGVIFLRYVMGER